MSYKDYEMKIANLEDEIDNLEKQNHMINDKAGELIQLNQKLREGLEFYADFANWSGKLIVHDHYKDFFQGNTDIYIGGKLARKILKEANENN